METNSRKVLTKEQLKKIKKEDRDAFLENIGSRIKRFRFRSNHGKGYTQEQVANILGLNSTRTYINYENGISEPSVSVLMGLSSLFGVSIDQLVGNIYEDEEDLLAPTPEEIEQAEYELGKMDWRIEVMKETGYDPITHRPASSRFNTFKKPAHHLVTNKKKK